MGKTCNLTPKESRAGARNPGARGICKSANSGVRQRQEGKVVVVLDDEALNRNSTARMAMQGAKNAGLARENLEVLSAATVEEAMEHILNNEVSLIVLDRKLAAGRWGKEVIERLLEEAPEKVGCAVMCTGSPEKVEGHIVGILGRGRIFCKLRDRPELLNLMEHVMGGGSVESWERPEKEGLRDREIPAKGAAPPKRERPDWL